MRKQNPGRGDRSDKQLARLRRELGIKTLAAIKQDEIARVRVLAKGDNILTAALLGVGKTTIYRSAAAQATKNVTTQKKKARR